MLSVREFEIPRTAVFGVKETADKVSAVSFYIRSDYFYDRISVFKINNNFLCVSIFT